MDVVTHNGKDYKKATLVAKEFGYTTDYIGQLCRAKKVDARLVGRAWYVNVDSLQAHKKNRYKADFAAKVAAKDPLYELEQERAAETTSPTPARRVAVEPVLKNKTLKITQHLRDGATMVPVQYDIDEEDLLPTIKKATRLTPAPEPQESEPRTRRMSDGDQMTDEERRRPQPAKPAKPIRVRIPKRQQTKPTTLRPEERPEIKLKGTVAVAAVADQNSEGETSTTLDADSTVSDEGGKGDPREVNSNRNASSVKRDNKKNKAQIPIKHATREREVRRKKIGSRPSANKSVSNFTPKSVAERGEEQTTRRRHRQRSGRATKRSTRHATFYAILIFLVLAIFIGFLIVTLRIDVVVGSDGSSRVWQLDLERLFQ